jgi:ubiquitin-conjugating enzyme E2 variant
VGLSLYQNSNDMMIFLKCLAIIVAADFVTGLVHFWMDQYGREDMPFVGKHVVEINILHHRLPRNMLQKNYFQLTYTSWLLGLILVIVAGCLGVLGWELAFLVVYAGNANQIHKWAHQSAKKNGRVITALQRVGLLQSRRHHSHHHSAPYDQNYCILTDWLNPVLHRLRFWEGIVFCLRKVNIHPVAGSNIRDFF